MLTLLHQSFWLYSFVGGILTRGNIFLLKKRYEADFWYMMSLALNKITGCVISGWI